MAMASKPFDLEERVGRGGAGQMPRQDKRAPRRQLMKRKARHPRDHQRRRGAAPDQGVGAEVLNLAYLDGYTTGAERSTSSINNLVAFTHQDPRDGPIHADCKDLFAKECCASFPKVNGEEPDGPVIPRPRIAVRVTPRC